MKRSNQVMLSAIFLAAVASATAKAQEAPVPATDTANKRNDSTANAVDTSLVSYNDGIVENQVPPVNAIYYGPPAPNYGFFHFYWVSHWNDYHYYHHHHHHHSRESYGPRTTVNNSPRTTTPEQHNGFRTTAPTQAANGSTRSAAGANTRSQAMASAPRTQGFGSTMRTSHASAHS